MNFRYLTLQAFLRSKNNIKAVDYFFGGFWRTGV